MCVERACIALLLGKTDQALQELGLTVQGQQQADSNSTRQAAQQYVLVRTWTLLRLPAASVCAQSMSHSQCCYPLAQLAGSIEYAIVEVLAAICQAVTFKGSFDVCHCAAAGSLSRQQ